MAIARFVWTHPANRDRRIQALARSVFFEVYLRSTGRTRRVPLGESSIVLADRQHDSSMRVLHANPPDWNQMQVWRQHLKPGDLFIDVGANIGLYTLWAKERGADVIAIEPDPIACARLREHLLWNRYEAEVLQCAAGAEQGFVTMTSGLDASNQLVLDGEGTIPMVRVDDLCGDRVIAGMKVDVEGAERLVLEGARRALEDRRIKLLQLEWNALSEELLGESRQPVSAMLAMCGYEMAYATEEGGLTPVLTPRSYPGAPDVFATPKQ